MIGSDLIKHKFFMTSQLLLIFNVYYKNKNKNKCILHHKLIPVNYGKKESNNICCHCYYTLCYSDQHAHVSSYIPNVSAVISFGLLQVSV